MQCPVCRALVQEGPSCGRCRADLSLLFALEARRAQLLARGQGRQAQGRWREALRAFVEAGRLRQDHDIRRWQAICWLMLSDFPRAYDSLTSSEEPAQVGRAT